MVLIAGLDEVGQGSLAGPLVIAVVAFEKDATAIPGVTDSKKLTETKREELLPIILEQAEFVGLGWASHTYIDEHGMRASWQYAANMALENCPKFQFMYVDGVNEVRSYRDAQLTFKKGDSRFWQIGAASIVAKVFRDNEMVHYHRYYPHYGWCKNKGYGTKTHISTIGERGATPIHRKLFLRKIERKIARLSKS